MGRTQVPGGPVCAMLCPCMAPMPQIADVGMAMRMPEELCTYVSIYMSAPAWPCPFAPPNHRLNRSSQSSHLSISVPVFVKPRPG